jgi:hypothetical protein
MLSTQLRSAQPQTQTANCPAGFHARPGVDLSVTQQIRSHFDTKG